VAYRSYPVVWAEDGRPGTATGSLTIGDDGRAVLAGMAGGAYRATGFAASDLEAIELVSSPSSRLNGRPTLAVALKDRGRILIAELIGFGTAAEVVAALMSWYEGGG